MLFNVFFAFLISLFFSTELTAVSVPCKPHAFSLGPEVYYLKRTKEGGSWQDGWLYGVSGTYERWPCKGFYWAADGYWATGEIEGKTASGNRLKSTLTQSQIEGRLGYSYCFNCCKSLFLAGYGAYGYFSNENSFKKPSPIPCTFNDNFDYGALGILTQWHFRECWSAGLHFKALFMNESKCNVTDDPDYQNLTQIIGCENQYELYLPLTYSFCWNGFRAETILSPFYRYRHFGFQENFPFDYFDTTYHIYGAKLTLQVVF